MRSTVFVYSTKLTRLRCINAKLVEALQQLVTDYEDVPDPSDADSQSVFKDARAAIAKATDWAGER